MKKIWKYWFDTNWKVWKCQNDVYGKSELMLERNVKRNENKEKSEKRIRKSEKERDLDLVVPGLREMCSRYSVYDGMIVAGTRATTE